MKLHRTNINLFEEDVQFLESHYGYGWTEEVRNQVHKRVAELRKVFDYESEPDECLTNQPSTTSIA